MTGKELIEWIKDNKAEELVVITAINDWYACDREPKIKKSVRGKGSLLRFIV